MLISFRLLNIYFKFSLEFVWFPLLHSPLIPNHIIFDQVLLHEVEVLLLVQVQVVDALDHLMQALELLIEICNLQQRGVDFCAQFFILLGD